MPLSHFAAHCFFPRHEIFTHSVTWFRQIHIQSCANPRLTQAWLLFRKLTNKEVWKLAGCSGFQGVCNLQIFSVDPKALQFAYHLTKYTRRTGSQASRYIWQNGWRTKQLTWYTTNAPRQVASLRISPDGKYHLCQQQHWQQAGTPDFQDQCRYVAVSWANGLIS